MKIITEKILNILNIYQPFNQYENQKKNFFLLNFFFCAEKNTYKIKHWKSKKKIFREHTKEFLSKKKEHKTTK